MIQVIINAFLCVLRSIKWSPAVEEPIKFSSSEFPFDLLHKNISTLFD